MTDSFGNVRGHGQWSEAFGREALEASRCGTRSRTVKSRWDESK